jgi:nicotinamidase-related amidase
MPNLSSQSLLIVIDLQKAIDDPTWGLRNNANAEDHVAELLAHWRKNAMPILHVKHMSTDPNSTYRPGSPGNEFKEVARPATGEEVLEKSSNSAFIRTNLDATLRERGISEVVIVGVTTNNSVEATARMAGNLRYRTIVVSDATYTFGQRDHGGRLHAAEVVHDMSLANLDGEYASVLTTAEVVSMQFGH